MPILSSKSFRLRFTRAERTIIRNSGQEDMAELREEMAGTDGVTTEDEYIQDLIAAIPAITDERVKEIIG